ncbi:MAG: hypothetical protein ABIG70_02905 [Pseudomonadota bacterium]
MTSTQRFLANNHNVLLNADLAASSVMEIADSVLEMPVARNGSARIALSGAYAGHEESTYEVEITDNIVVTPLISQPIFAGAGTGAISGISYTGTAQTFTVKLADLGQVLTAAGSDMEGVSIVARVPGAAGNQIHLSIDLSGLTYSATNFSLIKSIAAGSEALYGPEFDWDTKVMGADKQIPADAHRLVFGEDTSIVYRQYKVYKDAKWGYFFEPPLRRAIAQGTPVRFVSGSRTITLTDGIATEIYSGIVTLYDLLSALQTRSALVKVEGVVANDRAAGGMAARDLTTRTDAHCLPPSGAGSQYTDSALINYAALPGSATELIEVRCWANSSRQHPAAGVGKELWQVKGSVSGLVETMLQTGQDFMLANKFGFSIRPRLPDGYGVPRGRFSVSGINYQTRDYTEDEFEPPICVTSMALGPEAVDQSVTLVYRERPKTGDCACASMAAPDLSGKACLTGSLFNSQGGNMDPGHIARLSRIGAWHRDAVAGNTSINTGGELRTSRNDLELAASARDAFADCLADLYTSGTLSWPAWASDAETAEYAMIAESGWRYLAITTGTTGSTPPTWPTTIGETVVDGTVTWEAMDKVPEKLWDDALASLKADWALLDTMSSGLLETAITITQGSTVAVGDIVRTEATTAYHSSAVYRMLEAGTFGTDVDYSGIWWTGSDIPGTVGVLQVRTGLGIIDPPLRAVLLIPDGVLSSEEDIDAPGYVSGGISGAVNDFSQRYIASMDAVRAAAGISKKADASKVAGDGCWRDTGAPFWWEITGSSGGAYAPAFTNEPYFSCRDAGSGYFSTHEFAFQINVKCEASLKDGDQVTLSIGDAGWPSTYQVGDTLYLPVIAAQDLYLAGGNDGDNIQTWHVDGSMAGAFPPYLLDLDSPDPYSTNGLQFTITPGGIPFEAGDLYKFAVEGGHYRWRKDGGAWSVPGEITASPVPISDGLSAAFSTGSAPSFMAGDLYRFRALQPAALSNVINPDVEAWRWIGSTATLTASLGSGQSIDCAAFAFHTLPGSAIVTLFGGMDGNTWDWSEDIPWRAGVMAKLFSAKTAALLKLEITSASGGAIGWAWAGQAFATENHAECQLRRDYSVERGAGMNPSAAFLGATRSGEIAWQQGVLMDADMSGLLAMLDHIKTNDDEPMILIPQHTRPEEAYPVRVLMDEIDMPEDGGYQPNSGIDRRYGMKLSVKGVVA